MLQARNGLKRGGEAAGSLNFAVVGWSPVSSEPRPQCDSGSLVAVAVVAVVVVVVVVIGGGGRRRSSSSSSSSSSSKDLYFSRVIPAA